MKIEDIQEEAYRWACEHLKDYMIFNVVKDNVVEVMVDPVFAKAVTMHLHDWVARGAE